MTDNKVVLLDDDELELLTEVHNGIDEDYLAEIKKSDK